jgi:homoserine/homoserine lactone efflux protein
MTPGVYLAMGATIAVAALTPGPAVTAIVARAISDGVRPALALNAGVVTGDLLFLALAAAGMAAAARSLGELFTVLQWLGVAYLVWLGIQQWRAPVAAVDPDATGVGLGGAPRELLLRGFLVNATNPKGIVFMLAVLPQFIDPARPQLVQYAICGGTLFFTDLVVMSGYTGLAAKVLRLLREPHHIRWMNRTFGGLFVAAGAVLAVFKRGA